MKLIRWILALLTACTAPTEPRTATITVHNRTGYTAHVIIGDGDDIRTASRYATSTYVVPAQLTRIRITSNGMTLDTNILPAVTFTVGQSRISFIPF